VSPEHTPSSGDKPALNPAALGVEDAAKVLTRMGGKPVTAAMLEADIDAGAPTNADGTINLVHYAAWLVKEMASAPAPAPGSHFKAAAGVTSGASGGSGTSGGGGVRGD